VDKQNIDYPSFLVQGYWDVSMVGSVRGDLLGLHLSNFGKAKRGSSNFIQRFPESLLLNIYFTLR
jgi:hypothetical protein